jgi:manganese/iron transport system substrate-binding protein
MFKRKFILMILIGLLAVLTACSPTQQQPDKPTAVASTTMIGDVVHQVGGELINLHVLLPVDSDPHGFSPAPKDVAQVETANLVFLNGFNLEEGLADLITANAQGKIVMVSDGVQTIPIGSHEHDGEVQSDPSTQPSNPDPHVWMDPANVKIWTENIARELSAMDPENASIYQQNAQSYLAQLDQLNAWIKEQIGQIPQERRILVTDHDTLGYFAEAYNFRVIGVVVIGGSTLSDPSAQQIAALEKNIAEFNTPAIFVDTTVNPQMSERIAADTGAVLIRLYTGSLSAANGPAASYIEMMRYNVQAIVEALK